MAKRRVISMDGLLRYIAGHVSDEEFERLLDLAAQYDLSLRDYLGWYVGWMVTRRLRPDPVVSRSHGYPLATPCRDGTLPKIIRTEFLLGSYGGTRIADTLASGGQS